MSLCRGRLFFDARAERRSDDIGLVQSLNFDGRDEDSDIEDQLDSNRGPNFTRIQEITGLRTPTSSPVKAPSFWDSGLGSPTPTSPSPTKPKYSPTVGMVSPIPFAMFDSEEENIPICPPTPYTPPHKKFKSLRLYDTPHTPKSLLQKAQRRTFRSSVKSSCDQNSSKNSLYRTVLDPEGPQANVNPFTPESPVVKGKKRTRRALDGSFNEMNGSYDSEDEMPSTKKLALREINTSRYNEEFYEVCKLGDGEFGSVYKCINRLDGCTYAIKKSKMPVAGSAYERNALNEVYAHAVLGKHQHVVRYYSAWAENDHMYIQDEFCNGGSLADVISENKQIGTCLDEQQLKQILLQVAHGLKYIHSQGLVHLDIKPGNIFLHRNPRAESGVEADLEEEEEVEEPLTYKIGDLGHVTSIAHPLVEEGDCRYLPNEILQEDFTNLTKADIFSLALTVYEAGGGHDLPKNGDEWHDIRKGILPDLQQCSPEFNQLIKLMISEDPSMRPSAGNIIQNSVLCSSATKTKAQLRKELNEEKIKNELLTWKLKEAEKQQQLLRLQQKPRPNKPVVKVIGLTGSIVGNTSPKANVKRLVGKKCYRSVSTTCF